MRIFLNNMHAKKFPFKGNHRAGIINKKTKLLSVCFVVVFDFPWSTKNDVVKPPG